MDHQELAKAAYGYAEQHYGDKDARFDVIVECITIDEIAEHLEAGGIRSEAGAIGWAKSFAGAQHEQELNQAWDGPESCIGSSSYNPEYGSYSSFREEMLEEARMAEEAAMQRECAMDLEERFEHYAFEERNGMSYGSSF